MTTKPVRVAFVINDLLMGGAQMAVLAIASRLDRTRFAPAIYCLNAYGPDRPTIAAAFAANDIPVTWLGEGKTGIAAAIPALARLLHRDRPDVVHAHLIDAVISGAVAARLAGVRHVLIHEHQTHHMHSWKVRAALAAIRSLASATICYTPALENEIFGAVRELSAAPDTLPHHLTIRNGVDISGLDTTVSAGGGRAAVRQSLGIPERALVITSVARLVPWKGQLVLFEAFAQIAKQYPDAWLCLVGEGQLKEVIAARAVECGLADRVLLTGARTDAAAILAASDIASLTLIYDAGVDGEGIGLSGMEAMALGVPLVASRYPGSDPRVVDGENALLVTPNDSEALAEALRILLADPERRSRIGAAAAATARESMDWQAIVPIYERCYNLLAP